VSLLLKTEIAAGIRYEVYFNGFTNPSYPEIGLQFILNAKTADEFLIY
jgi:hypothetical protein